APQAPVNTPLVASAPTDEPASSASEKPTPTAPPPVPATSFHASEKPCLKADLCCLGEVAGVEYDDGLYVSRTKYKYKDFKTPIWLNLPDNRTETVTRLCSRCGKEVTINVRSKRSVGLQYRVENLCLIIIGGALFVPSPIVIWIMNWHLGAAALSM